MGISSELDPACLDPFDLASRCRKCGSLRPPDVKYNNNGWVENGYLASPFLRRTCIRCGFQWAERTLDLMMRYRCMKKWCWRSVDPSGILWCKKHAKGKRKRWI